MGWAHGTKPYAASAATPPRPKYHGRFSRTACHTSQPPPTSSRPDATNRNTDSAALPAVHLNSASASAMPSWPPPAGTLTSTAAEPMTSSIQGGGS